MRIALLGCGHKTQPSYGTRESYDNAQIVRFDNNPDCNPDIEWDVERLECAAPLPDAPYDEIHAYEVWEHFGQQGNYRGFFAGMNAVARSLKEGGLFYLTSPLPDSVWAWADPGHTRVLPMETWSFLTEAMYDDLGNSPVSDYRRYIEYWWEPIHREKISADNYLVVIRRAKERQQHAQDAQSPSVDGAES